MQHCVACDSLSWPWLSLSMVFLVQGTEAVWGMAPGVCSGSIADDSHPSLQEGSTAGVVAPGQVKLFLPGVSSQVVSV